MSGAISPRIAALMAAPLEHEGVRVVTFSQVDELHGHRDGRARETFNDNRSRFAGPGGGQ